MKKFKLEITDEGYSLSYTDRKGNQVEKTLELTCGVIALAETLVEGFGMCRPLYAFPDKEGKPPDFTHAFCLVGTDKEELLEVVSETWVPMDFKEQP